MLGLEAGADELTIAGAEPRLEFRPARGRDLLGEQRTHGEAERLVKLIVLRRQEDDRHRAELAHPPKQLHPVEVRHLDVEHAKVRRIVAERLQRRDRVRIDAGDEALLLESDRDRSQDVPVIIDQRDHLAHSALCRCLSSDEVEGLATARRSHKQRRFRQQNVSVTVGCMVLNGDQSVLTPQPFRAYTPLVTQSFAAAGQTPVAAVFGILERGFFSERPRSAARA